MGTGIQWTDESWNFLAGCFPASRGCDNCYARTMHDRIFLQWKRGQRPTAPQQYHQAFFRGVQIIPERLQKPYHWRKPRRVFANSVSDFYEQSVPDAILHQAFNVMIDTPRHTYQVLTKRAKRMAEFTNERARRYHWSHDRESMPPRNIWQGVSVEDQVAADLRIPWLLQTPAAIRWLSCEPLLGPVDLSSWLDPNAPLPAIHWVVIGGESGKKARPMEEAWMRDLIQQCQGAGVAVFVKQMGEVWARGHHTHERHAGDPTEWPEDLRIREFPAA